MSGLLEGQGGPAQETLVGVTELDVILRTLVNGGARAGPSAEALRTKVTEVGSCNLIHDGGAG